MQLCIYENLSNIKMPFGGPSELESFALTGALPEATLEDGLCITILIRQQAWALCNTIPQHNPSNRHEGANRNQKLYSPASIALTVNKCRSKVGGSSSNTSSSSSSSTSTSTSTWQKRVHVRISKPKQGCCTPKRRSTSNHSPLPLLLQSLALARLLALALFPVLLSEQIPFLSDYLSLHQSNGSPKLLLDCQPGLCFPLHAPLPLPPVQRVEGFGHVGNACRSVPIVALVKIRACYLFTRWLL